MFATHKQYQLSSHVFHQVDFSIFSSNVMSDGHRKLRTFSIMAIDFLGTLSLWLCCLIKLLRFKEIFYIHHALLYSFALVRSGFDFQFFFLGGGGGGGGGEIHFDFVIWPI